MAATYSAMRGGWPLSFEWEGKPPVKKRPRVTRRGTFAPDAAVERATRAVLARHAEQPMEGPLVLALGFWMPTRRWIDTDNLVKHVMDAGNGVLWCDDSQVVRLAGLRFLDRERPRTALLVGQLA